MKTKGLSVLTASLLILVLALTGCEAGDFTDPVYFNQIGDNTTAGKVQVGYFHELYVDNATLHIGDVPITAPNSTINIPADLKVAGSVYVASNSSLKTLDGTSFGGVGAQGIPGANGTNGSQGPQGIQGVPGTPGQNGTVGNVTWGDVTGILSNQTDLQSVLDAKDGTHNNRTILDDIQEALTTVLKNGLDWLITNITDAWKSSVDYVVATFNGTKATIDAHVVNTSNPHSVTKAQVGLSSADNTSDADKPISTVTQTALDTKQTTLVSGANIKTVNGNTLLGVGDLVVGGGGGMNLLKKTANQTINAGAATFTDITDLTFPVVSGTDYAFYFYITFQSASTSTGWKAGVNCPTGALDFWAKSDIIANGPAGVATHTERHNTVRDDMTLLTTTIAQAVDLSIEIRGRYCCTQDGTFAARFANELASNTQIVVQKGSYGWWY
jgi:hypothetical protein